jgi:hypothetical protein
LAADAAKTQRALETAGVPVPRVFAYPYGFLVRDGDAALRKLGFEASLSCAERIAVVTRGEESCLWPLPRFNRPSGISSEDFFRNTVGLKD